MTRRDVLTLAVGQVVIRTPRHSTPQRDEPRGGYHTNPWDISTRELSLWHPGNHPMLVHHKWAK